MWLWVVAVDVVDHGWNRDFVDSPRPEAANSHSRLMNWTADNYSCISALGDEAWGLEMPRLRTDGQYQIRNISLSLSLQHAPSARWKYWKASDGGLLTMGTTSLLISFLLFNLFPFCPFSLPSAFVPSFLILHPSSLLPHPSAFSPVGFSVALFLFHVFASPHFSAFVSGTCSCCHRPIRSLHMTVGWTNDGSSMTSAWKHAGCSHKG